jgi:hypothetical protein
VIILQAFCFYYGQQPHFLKSKHYRDPSYPHWAPWCAGLIRAWKCAHLSYVISSFRWLEESLVQELTISPEVGTVARAAVFKLLWQGKKLGHRLEDILPSMGQVAWEPRLHPDVQGGLWRYNLVDPGGHTQGGIHKLLLQAPYFDKAGKAPKIFLSDMGREIILCILLISIKLTWTSILLSLHSVKIRAETYCVLQSSVLNA